MGRKPSKNLNLPPRMRAREKGGRVYYTYDTGGRPRKEVPLGTDYVLAIQKWAELHEAPATAKITVGWAIGKYLESPQYAELGSGTQADYRYAIDKLLAKFADAPMDEVKPSHINLYFDDRVKQSKHRARREKTVLSMIYTWAIARDFCKTNPAAAAEKHKRLPGRKNVYIEDDMLEAVYQHASPALRDAMDLAYYLGQRPADVLKLTEQDIRSGAVQFDQNKTGRPMNIQVAGDLEAVIQRIKVRKQQFAVHCLALLVDEDGKQMTKAKLRSRFEAARDAAGVDGAVFQFRDLRRKAAADLRDEVGIEAAQVLLGHASVTQTEHYASGKARKVKMLPKKRAT